MCRDHFPDAGEFRRSFMSGETGARLHLPPLDHVPVEPPARRRRLAGWRPLDFFLVASIAALGAFSLAGRLPW